jgi:hypothetical protein
MILGECCKIRLRFHFMSTLCNGYNCMVRIEAAAELEIQETIRLIPAVVL